MKARGGLAAAPIALALVLTASAQAPSATYLPDGGGPVSVGPMPAGLTSLDAASCGECHADHLREWRGSAHARSATGALYLDEFSHRQRAWCSNCHAPRASAEAGVDCATCHVREGAVLNPTVSGRAPHASRAAPELATVAACAACHDFDFEAQPGDALQSTVREWRASGHADVSCQGCHMPALEGRRGHDFPGGLEPSLVRRSVEVRTARAHRSGGVTRLQLELAADAAGHAVPTGDIFRRLVVSAWPRGRPGEVARVTLARRFRVRGAHWQELDDRRVPARGSRWVEVEVPASAQALEWVIELWRTAPARARQHGWPASEMSREVARGVTAVGG